MQTDSRRRRGFALSELVVVILILALLAGALLPRVTDRIASAHDARRLADMHRLREAIERYHDERGAYPRASASAAERGYELSCDGAFLRELVERGYLKEEARDPLNDEAHSYAYNVFAEGTCGCRGQGPFYVLGLRKFETPEYAAEHPGSFKCVQKDWGADLEYVTGGGIAAGNAGESVR